MNAYANLRMLGLTQHALCMLASKVLEGGALHQLVCSAITVRCWLHCLP